MELDRYLSFLTRRLPRIRGMARVIKPLRGYYAKKYDSCAERRIIINEYDHDISMELDRSSYMGGSIYWLGYHHWREMDYFRENLKPGMTFIDVGANQGEFTLFAAKYLRTGSVLSFEPEKTMFQALKKNIELNSFDNIQYFNFGLGNKDGILKLYTSSNVKPHGGIHEGLFTTYPDGSRNEYVQEISIKRLDDALSNTKTARVDFIKIDVEGAELFVLQGAEETIRLFKPKLMLELNEETFRNAGYGTSDLIGFLEKHNYRIYKFLYGGKLKEIDLKANGITSASFNILCQI